MFHEFTKEQREYEKKRLNTLRNLYMRVLKGKQEIKVIESFRDPRFKMLQTLAVDYQTGKADITTMFLSAPGYIMTYEAMRALARQYGADTHR